MTAAAPSAPPPGGQAPRRLSVLAVDDEAPALDEISYLLGRSPLVGEVVAVGGADDALRQLAARRFDAVLLDIRMPGLGGMALARALERSPASPAVIFVTAHEEYTVDAFDVDAVGYLLKPVDEGRLLAALQRAAASSPWGGDGGRGDGDADGWELIAAETGGRTVMVARDEVDWVEAAGDYVRLHRPAGSHLVRVPMAQLQERWEAHGFCRVHRGYLVALRAVRELRTEGARTVVVVADRELPVSRRHLRDLRERLVRHAWRPGR